ncbi:hypothetical protein [Riemerella anatipestifer]|uniref:hypothetical protein n=1 Tax=Riemerella anatipestifer TaxID=34085 RepID=UPI001C6DE345|nr:hypothetical protein [Riemerella anatipestifer]QYR03853.1 hypothetical protein J6M00_05425 [Riemerella anatipestifer]
MKYSFYLMLFFSLSCTEQSDTIKENDINGIVYINNGDIFNIEGNYYILDKRYKDPGRHELKISETEVSKIKKFIVEKEIYKFGSSFTFLELCKSKACQSEIIIHYKCGKKQIFIFDNYLYIENRDNSQYHKIWDLERLITNIIMNKKIDPEPLNVTF